MRFLFINPFYPLEELPSPPLGVGYLAASLERAGIEVRVYDLVVSRYSEEKLEAIMDDFQPDIVGATSVTMTFMSAIRAIEAAKRIDPRVVTAMGGAHVSYCAEKTLQQHPGLDIVAMAEGEEMIIELCDAVAGKRPMDTVKGLVWRDGDMLNNNGPREGWLDVNTLPIPARHLTPLARYRGIRTPISMTTSRGCPFQCIFCTGRKLVGPSIRWRNAESVVDEMEHIASLGFHQVNLADDLFTARKPHAYAVCDEIIKRGVKLTWTSFANVNTVDVPLLTRMREAGCVTVSFGLESGNQEILRTVKKGTKIPNILKAVDACMEAGVHPHGSFIVGLPGETKETLRETIAFANTLREMGAQTGFHMLAPFPGTPVYDEAEKFGIKILTENWDDFHANHAITENDALDRETAEAVVDEIYGAVGKLFGELAERIKNGTASTEDVERYAIIERQGVYYDMMMKDVLETYGSWHTDTTRIPESEAIEGVVGIVSRATERPHDMVERAVRYGLDNDLLRYTSADGVCRWEFADSPQSLLVTEVVRQAPLRLEQLSEPAQLTAS
jgi:anaerobic magnesium-protoporphyrin IX monomethyl ester cyclase